MARTAAASGLRIEYGLIAAGIAVAIIAAVNGLGSQVKAGRSRECPLLAQSGHAELHRTCLLLTQSGH